MLAAVLAALGLVIVPIASPGAAGEMFLAASDSDDEGESLPPGTPIDR